MAKNYTITNVWEKNPYYNTVKIRENRGTDINGKIIFAYAQITMNTEHKNGKLTKGDQFGKIFTYEIKRYEDDTICGYTSQLNNYISEEAINQAEKTLNKNFSQMKKIRKLGLTFEQFSRMEEIVKEFTKTYRDDFYWYDVYGIGLNLYKNETVDYIWIVRECGTVRCKWGDETFRYYQKNDKTSKFYHVTKNQVSLQPV